jgi:hypothetical protein
MFQVSIQASIGSKVIIKSIRYQGYYLEFKDD